MDIQKILEKELKRLQNKYRQCHEFRVEWKPCTKEYDMPYDRKAELAGQVDEIGHVLEVYATEVEEALHVLRHEFFESCFNKLIRPYIDYANNVQRGLEKAFMQTNYWQKECFIENFVAQEEEDEVGDKREK